MKLRKDLVVLCVFIAVSFVIAIAIPTRGQTIDEGPILLEEDIISEPPSIKEEISPLPSLQEAIAELQPWYRQEGNDRALSRITEIISQAALENDIDPILAAAIAMRESSLMISVGEGALGEVGLFQVMPRGIARQVCPRRCDIRRPACNADTALCYLSFLRDYCGPQDTWIWMGAYGMSRCPTSEEARRMVFTRRTRNFVTQVVGERYTNEIWPDEIPT